MEQKPVQLDMKRLLELEQILNSISFDIYSSDQNNERKKILISRIDEYMEGEGNHQKKVKMT